MAATSRRSSDAMRAREVVACARDALASHGTPGVTSGGQGPAFGSEGRVSPPAPGRAAQGTGGRARWADDVPTGRRLGTPRSECLGDAEHETPARPEDMIRGFVDEYDTTRPHQSLGHATPSTWHLGGIAGAA